MPMGRPTKYDPEMLEAVHKMGNNGETITQCAVKLGVNRDTVYRWMEKHEEFSDAIKGMRDRALVFWEGVAAQQAITGKGNATAMIFMIKNQFPDDYADRKELDVDGKLGVFEIDFTGYEDPEDSPEDE